MIALDCLQIKQPGPVTTTKTRLFTTAYGQWMLLLLSIAVYLLLFIFYYPPISAIEDEVGFVNQAIVWSKGAVSAESAGYSTMMDFVKINGRNVAWRNPGRSLMILPFIVLGSIRSIFITGALIHVAMTLIAALIHDRLGQSPLWATLVLYHPTLGIYSRTIMGDTPAAFFLLLSGFLVLSRTRPGLWAGICLGVAAVMRYHTVVVLPFLAAAMWLDSALEQPKLESLKFVAASSIVVAMIGLYNVRLYGAVSGITEQGYFAGRFLVPHLLFYSAILLSIWPGMLVAPLLDQTRECQLARATCFPILLVFAFYYYHDRGSSWAEDMVLGQRLIQCVLPIWIVAYSSVISRKIVPWFNRRMPALAPAACGITILLLVSAQWYTFQKHQNHLRLLRAIRNEVVAKVPAGATIVANYTMQKLFGIADPALPGYSWIRLDTAVQGSGNFAQPELRWFCGVLPKGPGDQALKDLPEFIRRHGLIPIPTRTPDLLLYSTQDH